MQNSKNKARFTLLLTIILAIIFTALRIVLLYNNYNFEEGFFEKRSLATAFYISLCVVALLLVIFKKKFSETVAIKNKNSNILSFFDILLSLSFLILAVSLVKESNILYTLFAFVSALSYLVLFFKKEKNALTSILNLAPLLYFLLCIVFSFISVSGRANSYNSFADIVSLIAIAFFVLFEGKPLQKEQYPSVYTSYLAGILLVAPSVIPDIMTVITKDVPVTLGSVAGILVKLFFLFKMIAKAVSANVSEDKE